MVWLDKQKYGCLFCGHKWIIKSDKMITDKQHILWIKETLKEHRALCKGVNDEL